MWTTSVQSADPRWGVGAKRPTVVHDLIVSTLSAGPVGFGDLVGKTDAQLLAMATRKDGNILKPAATALRIERSGQLPFWRHFGLVVVLPRQARTNIGKGVFCRWYLAAPVGGAEIWAAPTGPAGSADSGSDARANSMVLLGQHEEEEDEEEDDRTSANELWWWSILATDVDGEAPSGAPLELAELWPAPASSTQLLVATLQRTEAGSGAVYHGSSNGYGRLGTTPRPTTTTGGGTSITSCVNGSKASSCLALWDATTPLAVGTVGTAPTDGDCSQHSLCGVLSQVKYKTRLI